jgi:hypothetical protein
MKLIKTMQSKALFVNTQPWFQKMYKGIENKQGKI